jgi:pyridoxamine 5'-phosphate oxidase
MMKEIESATDDTETGRPHVSVTGSGLTSQHPLFTEALGKLRTRLLDTSGSQETMLATSGASGMPSLRSISIYDIDDKGILYFANGRSRHATQLRQNRHAALCCSIAETDERLLVEGEVEATERSILTKWWDSRSRQEQLLAWASNQSAPLDRLATLERRMAQCRTQFVDGVMPAPPHWVGFRLVPNRFEFTRPAQRHLVERICYSKSETGWVRTLLNP